MKILRDTFRLFFNTIKEVLTPGPESLGHIMARQGPRDKETILADMKEILEFLKELGVEVTAEPKVEEMKSPYRKEPEGIYVSVELPYSRDSDYSFDLSFYDDGQRNIGARLIDKNDNKRLDLYFWYSAFEVWDYYELDELVNDFNRNLKLIVENETQVIQSEFYGDWEFGCIALVDGKWVKVKGGSIALRKSNFKFPKVKGLRKTCKGLPLVSRNRNGGESK